MGESRGEEGRVESSMCAVHVFPREEAREAWESDLIWSVIWAERDEVVQKSEMASAIHHHSACSPVLLRHNIIMAKSPVVLRCQRVKVLDVVTVGLGKGTWRSDSDSDVDGWLGFSVELGQAKTFHESVTHVIEDAKNMPKISWVR